jgi:hypothetical protein
MPQWQSARQSMSQIEVSLLFVHRANLQIYKKLLATDLSDTERMLFLRKITEAEEALIKLGGN